MEEDTEFPEEDESAAPPEGPAEEVEEPPEGPEEPLEEPAEEAEAPSAEESEEESEEAVDPDAVTEEEPDADIEEYSVVQVWFTVTPEDASLTVYEKYEEEITELQSEEDGSWLLLPGEYSYIAAAEGYKTAEGTFEVFGDDPFVEITVALIQSEDDAPVEAMSASGTCGSNLTWTLDNAGTLTINGAGKMKDYYEYDDGDYIWEPAEWYTYRNSIKKVIINSGVTSIGAYAFEKMNSISMITIAPTVTSIGRCAFEGCIALQEVNLPDSVTTMGVYVFQDCSSLSTVILSTKLTYTGTGMFQNCTALSKIVIPEGIKSISGYTFSGCKSLTEITIPTTLTSVGANAFYGCSKLTKVSLNDLSTWLNIDFAQNGVSNPLSPREDGQCAALYVGGIKLTNLEIPSGITELKNKAFYGYKYLQTVTIPSTVSNMGESVFASCSSLQSAVVCSSSLGDSAFKNCASLQTVFLAEGLTTIERYAFWECESLCEISIPSTVSTIKGCAFYGCDALEKVNIIDLKAWCQISFSTGSYGEPHYGECYSNPLYYARSLYLNNEKLETITLPSDVRFIRNYVFINCSLTTVILEGDMPNIDDKAFSGVQATVHYPAENLTYTNKLKNYGGTLTWVPNGGFLVTYDANGGTGSPVSQTKIRGETLVLTNDIPTFSWHRFLGWATRAEATEAEYQPGDSYTDERAVTLYAVWKDKTYNGDTIYSSGRIGSLTWELHTYEGTLVISGNGGIPDYDAYSSPPWTADSWNIRNIVIEGGVTSLGYFCFNGLDKVKEVVIANTVKTIKAGVFLDCTSLESIAIPSSVTNIGGSAFKGCTKLSLITLPDGITTIESNTFQCCSSLTAITIPANVSEIREYAFNQCAKLHSVEIPKSVKYINICAFSYCNELTDIFYGGTYDDWSEISIGDYNEGIDSAILHFADGSIYGELRSGMPWILDETGTLSIRGTGATPNYSYPNYAPWKNYSSEIKRVVIADGVTSIGDYLFYDCSNLKSITIPSNVNNIGNSAFYKCSSLTDITIPDTVTSIGGSAFHSCSSLMSVTIPSSVKSVESYTFCNCSSLTSITIQDGVTNIKERAFGSCDHLSSVVIPNSVTSLEREVFSYCPELKTAGPKGSGCNIEYGWAVSIPENAFYGCNSLKSIVLPDGITGIGNSAFYATGITGITIPDSVTSIGDSAFSNNSLLTSITIPDSVTSIGDSVFYYCFSLTSVEIPDSVTSIGPNAFADCWELMSIEIPDSVTSIGYCAFQECYGLTSITIPNSVTSIGEYAFMDCEDLSGIVIPERVTCIAYGTFAGCSSLTSVTIPASVTSIEQYAFASCSSLKTFTLEGDLPSVEDKAFSGVTATVFYPSSNRTYTAENMQNYGGSLTWEAYATGICGDNLFWKLDNNGLLTISGTGVMAWNSENSPWYNNKNVKTVIIEPGVTTVGQGAFYGCSNMESITIPSTVENIGNVAFSYCSALREITVPGSVRRIGDSAFFQCDALQSVILNEGTNVIDVHAFYYCSELVEITLPNTLTSLGAGAFKGCSKLKQISIPESITTIEFAVFYECTDLTDIYYGGCEAQWNEIAISASNTPATSARKHFAKAMISYNANGGHNAPDAQIITNGAQTDLSTQSPNRDGYKFLGWAFTADSSTAAYQPGARFIAAGDIILYAVWEKADPTSGTCGENLTWTLDENGLLTISGTGAMDDYSASNPAPWGTGAGKVIIEDGVTSIGSSAFDGCSNLSEVKVSSTVEEIGKNAFRGCTSLSKVSYDSDADHWEAIQIGSGNDLLTDTQISYPAHNHSWSGWTVVRAATCTGTGTEQRTCSYCRKTEERTIQALGHTPGGTVRENEKPATCTAEGSYDEVVYCTACGTELSREKKTVAAAGHRAGTPVRENEVAATYTTEGSYDEVVYCTVCGVELSREHKTVGKQNHTHQTELQNVKEATCTEAGYTGDAVCILCNERIKTGTTVPALGHSTEIRNARAATCTATGYTGDEICSVCGDTVKTGTVIEKLAHRAGAAVHENETAATCSAEGSFDEVVYCSVCHGELSRTGKRIAKLSHTAGKAVHENRIAATCTSAGSYDEVIYCSVCGAELSREKKMIGKLAHTPSEAVHENEVPATCRISGSYDEVIYCSVCGNELSRTKKTSEPAGHKAGTPLRENEIVATYTTEGSYDEVVYCTVCGVELRREHKILGKLDHTHQAVLQYVREATCTEDGYTGDKICTLCNELVKSGEVIPALGHKTELRNSKEATCSETGYTGDEVCTVCGETVKTGTIIGKLAHTAGTAVRENVIAATCSAKGSYDEVVYCSVCHAELSRVKKSIEKKPHTDSAPVRENEKLATCSAKGSYDEVVYCSVCHAELSRVKKTIEKKPHTDGAPVRENEKPATCTAKGSYDEVVYCSVCHAELSRVKKTIEKKPHSESAPVRENEKAAICSAEGSYDEVVYCSVCHEELSRVKKTIEKKPHTDGTPVRENEKPATCSAEGSYDEVVYCSICHAEISRVKKTIDKKPHTDGSPVRENEKPATCSAEGSYDEVTYCSVCKTELSRVKKTIEKKPHTDGSPVRENEKPATCSAEGSYDEVTYCSVCKTELSRKTFRVEKIPHRPETVNVKEPTETEMGYTGDTVCSVCGEVLGRGEAIPMLEPDWSGLPEELKLDRGYLLLNMDTGTVKLETNLTDPAYLVRVDWKTESGKNNVVSVSDGTVTVKGPGTDYVIAAISNGEKTLTARCRIDVLDEKKQAEQEIQVILPVKQITSELYKTDYARFSVVLRLEQNVQAASVTLADGTELEDTGVTITKAEFAGGGKQNILNVFRLRIVDDRTLEIVPIIDLNNKTAVKNVASTYKSAVILSLSNGQVLRTPELTVKVSKALPKLKAAQVKLNSFINGDTAPIIITGGRVESFTASADAKTKALATCNGDLSLTVKKGASKGSGSFSLTCKLEDWAVDATVKVPVSVVYTAPKMTLSPASVTLNSGIADRAEAAVTLVPLPGMSHQITADGVSGLSAKYNEATQRVELQVGKAAPGNYKLPVKADGKQVALLTVKVLPKTSPASLTAKAAGVIDTTIPDSPVVITVTGKNFNAAAGVYTVQILQTNKKLDIIDQPANSMFNVTTAGNVITITGKDALKKRVTGYSYSAVISTESIKTQPVTVKFTVKASPKSPAASVTLKATGGIDVLRQGTQAVITPTFKNWYGYDLSRAKLYINGKLVDGRDSMLFEKEFVDGHFVITPKYGVNINPKTTYSVTMSLDGYTTKPVKLPVKMGTVKIDQSVKSLTLLKNDRFDRQTVKLILNDDTLYDIDMARVELDAKSSAKYSLTKLGNGEYAIGYKKNILPDSVRNSSAASDTVTTDPPSRSNAGGGAAAPSGPADYDSGPPKSDSVKLNVFLRGNGGTTANKVITVSLKLV
ncbi:MAG: leucine-rich repeat protein [Oscillospiraceae bacterium]|nr:leucine-rich repeat protein [Oscillospiraceae bacterium]